MARRPIVPGSGHISYPPAHDPEPNVRKGPPQGQKAPGPGTPRGKMPGGKVPRYREPSSAARKPIIPGSGHVSYPKPHDPEPSGKLTMSSRMASETLPGGRYPMPDLKHARLALSMINRGNLTTTEKAKVRTRANSMLGRK